MKSSDDFASKLSLICEPFGEAQKEGLEQQREATLATQRESNAEQRAERLARANRVLTGVSRSLVRASEQASVLPIILQQAAAATGAIDGVLYEYEANAAQLRVVCALYEGHASNTLPGHPHGDKEHPVHVTAFPAWEQLLEGGEPLFLAMKAGDIATPSFEWHRARGHRAILQSALVIEGKPLGLFGLAFREDPSLAHTDMELFNALAQQATMVMHLSQLNAQAQAAAVAREQGRATAEERARLAREMHDTLLQGFTGVTMQMRALSKELRGAGSHLATKLDSLFDEATAAIREARRAVGDMRGGDPAGPTLRELLESFLELERERHPEITIDLHSSGETACESPRLAENLFRIAREGVRNALQHARASRVQVDYRVGHNSVCLRVSDDGTGFLQPVAASNRGHWGLIGIEERVKQIGGRCTIEGPAGRGVSITVEAPCHGE